MPALTEAIPSRPYRLAFLGLIAVNLMAAGLWLGDQIFDPPVKTPRIVDVSHGAITQALPDRVRKEFLIGLQANPAFAGLTREAIAADRASLAAALTAEPFDGAGLAALLSEQAAKVASAQSALEALLVTQIGALSVEERAAMAVALSR